MRVFSARTRVFWALTKGKKHVNGTEAQGLLGSFLRSRREGGFYQLQRIRVDMDVNPGRCHVIPASQVEGHWHSGRSRRMGNWLQPAAAAKFVLTG